MKKIEKDKAKDEMWREDAWGGGGVSQNLSSVTNDSFCYYKILKSLLLIGYQQICH